MASTEVSGPMHDPVGTLGTSEKYPLFGYFITKGKPLPTPFTNTKNFNFLFSQYSFLHCEKMLGIYAVRSRLKFALQGLEKVC
jgi:hypothetical protein